MGFDDEDSVRCKAQFIKEKGLIGASPRSSGAMVDDQWTGKALVHASGGLLWDLPEDDFPNGSPIVTAFSEALGL